MSTFGDALILIASVREALKKGVVHCDIHGKKLTTDKEILEALLRDGKITFEEPGRGKSCIEYS